MSSVQSASSEEDDSVVVAEPTLAERAEEMSRRHAALEEEKSFTGMVKSGAAVISDLAGLLYWRLKSAEVQQTVAAARNTVSEVATSITGAVSQEAAIQIAQANDHRKYGGRDKIHKGTRPNNGIGFDCGPGHFNEDKTGRDLARDLGKEQSAIWRNCNLEACYFSKPTPFRTGFREFTQCDFTDFIGILGFTVGDPILTSSDDSSQAEYHIPTLWGDGFKDSIKASHRNTDYNVKLDQAFFSVKDANRYLSVLEKKATAEEEITVKESLIAQRLIDACSMALEIPESPKTERDTISFRALAAKLLAKGVVQEAGLNPQAKDIVTDAFNQACITKFDANRELWEAEAIQKERSHLADVGQGVGKSMV